MSTQRQVEHSVRRRSAAARQRRGFWFAPLTGGALLVLFGILIYVFPSLLQFMVATVFIFVGLTLMTVGWQMRSRIVYRRVDFGAEPPTPPV